jgi:ATP-dependent protease HslVU (ClpYQ) peptidase subunit
MSIIAALCSSTTCSTWIASDTMVCSGALRQIAGPKWIVRRPWAAGVAGHLRTINVLQHHAAELLQGLASPYEFAHRVRELLSADGYSSAKNDGGPPEYGQMLMLAHPGGIWAVAADFSVMPLPVDRLWAEGSGRELALGAAHALLAADAGLAEKDVVRHAVDAAIVYDSNCGGSL